MNVLVGEFMITGVLDGVFVGVAEWMDVGVGVKAEVAEGGTNNVLMLTGVLVIGLCVAVLTVGVGV